MALIRAMFVMLFTMMAASAPPMIKGYQPTIIEKYLNVTQDGYTGVTRFHSRGGMDPRIIVVHVQEGNNWGSWQWFHQVLASSTVLISRAGSIWKIVHEWFAPWTNGDVNSPDYFMQTVMNRWGWDPNTYSLTIEREGLSGQRADEQDKAIVWQVWDWMQRFDIQAIYIVGHFQINSVSRPNCPDPAPHPLITMIKNAVSGTDVPVIDGTSPGHDLVRDPWKVIDANGKAWDGLKNIVVNDIPFYADKRIVRPKPAGVNQRQWASSTSNLVGTLLTGATKVLGWVEGEEVAGERRWWVAETGARIWAGGTNESPSMPAPEPVRPDDGLSKPDQGNNRDAIPVLLNGNTYYPVDSRDPDGKIRRPVRTKVVANARLWAATHSYSPVVETLPKGTTRNVTHWVKGESVDIDGLTDSINRDIWYVLEHESGDGIRKGGRIWSGLIELL